MIRDHRGSLKVEERTEGAFWVLRFKVTRESDHKRVERTRVIGRVQDFQQKRRLLQRRNAYACIPSSRDRNAECSSLRLPQPPACVNLVPGGDRNRLQNHSGHAALGRPFNPAQGLRALAHGQAHGGPSQDDRGHGSERENRSRSHSVGVGDRPWVILPVSCRQISDNFFRMMVARDGVEPPTPAFSGLRSTT